VSVAFIFEKAMEKYRKHLAEEANNAIKKSNKSGALLLRITTDKRFRITAEPPTDIKECFAIFDEYGLEWDEFRPFYEQVLREEKEKY